MLQYSIAILPALVLLLLQQPQFALTAFIVLGQGHFLLTYLYQYRGGKCTGRYLVAYAGALPLVFWFAHLVSPAVLLTVTALVFAVHYFYDEVRILTHENHALPLTALVPAVLIYTSYMLVEQFALNLFPITLGISAVLLASTVIRFGWRALWHPAIIVCNGTAGLLLILYLSAYTIPSELILGAIIIHHYTTWYIFQYRKLRTHTPRLSQYVTDVLTVNVALVSLFVLYATNTGCPILQYVFEPQYFYAWTILHILFASHELGAAVADRARHYRTLLRRRIGRAPATDAH